MAGWGRPYLASGKSAPFLSMSLSAYVLGE